MPTDIRQQIIIEARTWIGTPFHHQARARGHGVDCGQLVIGVGEALGLCETMDVRNYGRAPNPRQMRGYLEHFLAPHEGQPGDGDILWVCVRVGLPMHLLIISDAARNRIIHAHEPDGGVVETTNPFPPALIHSAWRYRGVD